MNLGGGGAGETPGRVLTIPVWVDRQWGGGGGGEGGRRAWMGFSSKCGKEHAVEIAHQEVIIVSFCPSDLPHLSGGLSAISVRVFNTAERGVISCKIVITHFFIFRGDAEGKGGGSISRYFYSPPKEGRAEKSAEGGVKDAEGRKPSRHLSGAFGAAALVPKSKQKTATDGR